MAADRVRQRLGEASIMTGVRALACSATNATLSDGTRLEAKGVIDARGLRNVTDLTGGWQKFVGRRFLLSAPHGLEAPIVKDATVEQIDGYRFTRKLPLVISAIAKPTNKEKHKVTSWMKSWHFRILKQNGIQKSSWIFCLKKVLTLNFNYE